MSVSNLYALVQNKERDHDSTMQCCLTFAGGKVEELNNTNYQHLASSPPTHILVQPPPDIGTSSPLYTAASSKYTCTGSPKHGKVVFTKNWIEHQEIQKY